MVAYVCKNNVFGAQNLKTYFFCTKEVISLPFIIMYRKKLNRPEAINSPYRNLWKSLEIFDIGLVKFNLRDKQK